VAVDNGVAVFVGVSVRTDASVAVALEVEVLVGATVDVKV
jgi:hypothetical protein